MKWLNDNWILTEGVFSGDIDLEGMGIKDDGELEEFIFDIRELAAVNKCSRDGFSTIWFKNGNTITVNIPLAVFIKRIEKSLSQV